jgi:hypothetical protein
MKVFSANI